MNLSTWAIRNPVPPITLFLVLCLLGLVGFLQLPVTRFPSVDVPVVNVTVLQPGAAPTELASSVTELIEDALAQIAGVESIASTVTDSRSVTTLSFGMETSPDRALADVNAAIAQLRTRLPAGLADPIVSRVDFSDLPILTWAVGDPNRSIEGLSHLVDDEIARRLQAEAAIGHVERIGGAERAVTLALDPGRLAALGLTAAEVSRQVRASQVDLSAGRGDLGSQEVALRALGAADSIAALGELPIRLPSGASVPLQYLGQIADGAVEARSFAMLDGVSVVAFNVYRASGHSDVAAADAAREVLGELQKRFPDVAFRQVEDASLYTLGSYGAAIETLIEGALLAVIVVLLFLRNWRATLITALALPLSIVPTFMVMDWLGFSLNTVSLLGITLVTGILVDDAIVEIENIVRHMRRGVSPLEAAEEAASEIGTAVIAISLTIVAVFVPVSFMSGLAGAYFSQFGLTVAIAVLFSLLVARLITPMLAAYFLTPEAVAHEQHDGPLMQRYLRVLHWTLQHRRRTLLIGVGIFLVSILSAGLLPSTLIPSSDEGRSNLSITLPPGSTLDQTFATARRLSERLQGMDEVASVFVQGGGAGVNSASASVYYVERGQRRASATELARQLPARLADEPDLQLVVLGSQNTQDLSVSVLADSTEAAQAAALQLVEQMRGLDGLLNITTAAALRQPELRIEPRAEVAAQLGVSTAGLASTVSLALLGDLDGPPAQMVLDGRQVPIRVRLDETARYDLDLLGLLPIPSASGGSVPLGAIADLRIGSSPSAIARYDRQAQVAVSADLAEGTALGSAIKQIQGLPLAKAMPAGTRLQTSGDAEAMGKVFNSFLLAMGMGFLLVYTILVLLFGSFMTPVTIVLSLPLSIGGAILALFLTGNAISMPVLIGFLMLMGIVTKNAIMLVEFAVESMRAGTERSAAVIDAAHKRARPIIMTTVAMVAGMLPSAFALGTGGEFRAPMAIAVIGGLLLSTLLSLLFVPSLFSVLDEQRMRLLAKARNLVGMGHASTGPGRATDGGRQA